jgi:ATP-dependent Clp protease ATP-binding subunit ClpA
MLEAAVEEQYTLSLSKNAAEKTYRALKAALKGQDEAIEEVYEGLVGIEQGLSSPKKPALSLAFFGPSGVGKTETAKIIAREFCGSEKALVKIDAGQFNTPQDLDKLFDGHGGGILVSALQQNPRCCILIDEIEKAPAALAYNLMALLDEGIVRDSAGQPQSAKGAIVILTSNVGSDLEVGAVHQTGFTRESVTDDDVAKAIRGRFKNEFLGRIDKIVVFHHLQTSALEAIVEADVETLKAHSSAEVKELPWHKEDTAKVLAESDVKRQGARALEKNVSAQLLDRLFEERSAKKSA